MVIAISLKNDVRVVSRHILSRFCIFCITLNNQALSISISLTTSFIIPSKTIQLSNSILNPTKITHLSSLAIP